MGSKRSNFVRRTGFLKIEQSFVTKISHRITIHLFGSSFTIYRVRVAILPFFFPNLLRHRSMAPITLLLLSKFFLPY